MVAILSVPVTKARGMGPLPELLAGGAGSRALQRVFRLAELPLEIIHNRNSRIPLVSMVRLFENAARLTGDRRFGLHVGEAMNPVAFGPWAQYCTEAPSVGIGLVRSVATARFQQTGGNQTLDYVENHALWRYHPPRLTTSRAQHSDHIVYPMLNFLKRFLGTGWKPAWIELDYPWTPDCTVIEEHLPAPVRFARQCIGIAIPMKDLARPRGTPLARPMTLFDVEMREERSGFDPVRTLLGIANMRLMDGRTDIDGVAEILGVGVQSLQRILRREGITYRDMIGSARAARAKALLRETCLSVTEIAFSLGYSDHANFTRAFARWVGCPPSAYRDRHRHQTEGFVAPDDPQGRIAD